MATLDTWGLKSKTPHLLPQNWYVLNDFRQLKHHRTSVTTILRALKSACWWNRSCSDFHNAGSVRLTHSIRCLCFQSKALGAEDLCAGDRKVGAFARYYTIWAAWMSTLETHLAYLWDSTNESLPVRIKRVYRAFVWTDFFDWE
jgi:hypothetical protein